MSRPRKKADVDAEALPVDASSSHPVSPTPESHEAVQEWTYSPPPGVNNSDWLDAPTRARDGANLAQPYEQKTDAQSEAPDTAADRAEKLAEIPASVSLSPALDPQRARYIEFITTEMNLSREFAAANYDRDVGPRITAVLTQDVIDKLTSETFATRPKGEDAIAYYARVWSDMIGQGRLFIDDIEEYDYPLLKGIDNAITKLVRERGGERSDHYPPHYPAPRRSAPVHHPQQETNRAAHKRAQAAYYERLRSASR